MLNPDEAPVGHRDDARRHAPWPSLLLDVGELRRQGLGPLPFQQFVVKTHARCNLDCDYCYVYRGADASWRDRPQWPSARTAGQTAFRIAEHIRRYGLRRVRIDLHGGEPLLRGAAPLVALVGQLRAPLPDWCEPVFTVQTNGTLLTERAAVALAGAGVGVGISVDGGSAALNRHRLDHGGRPSWPAVARALRLMDRHPALYGGILTTVDVHADPVAVYDSLAALRPPALNLLLPYAHWSDPPSAPPGAHGRWLAQVFDRWWASSPAGPPVRLFVELIGLLLGRPSTTEALGLSPSAVVVVETDGAIELSDGLRTTYATAAVTGLDVFRHAFHDALDLPGVVARQIGRAALAEQCRGCALVEVCGGGNYAHRYLDGEGFRHPSVYCTDLELLIRHVAARLAESVGSLHPTGESPVGFPG